MMPAARVLGVTVTTAVVTAGGEQRRNKIHLDLHHQFSLVLLFSDSVLELGSNFTHFLTFVLKSSLSSSSSHESQSTAKRN